MDEISGTHSAAEPLPGPADLAQYRVRRDARVAGLIHEYRLAHDVDEVFGTHNRSARILAAGHAFVQNLRRDHYEIATDVPAHHKLRTIFDELALTI